jgi:hypothetical protein
MPAVEQRLAAVCDAFNRANDVLLKAQQSLDRFTNIGVKHGDPKQLPRDLCWEITRKARLTAVPGDESFYADTVAALRATEREAAEKVYDTLVAAKRKHIEHLHAQRNIRDVVARAMREFHPILEQHAAQFNADSGADPLALSQTNFAFPTDAVAAHFEQELHKRLTAATLARINTQQEEKQRREEQLAEEHKAQETVLAGAHTGKTIAMLAQKEAEKLIEPVRRQLAALQKQQQQPRQQQQPPSRQQQQPLRSKHTAPKTQQQLSRGRPHTDAASSRAHAPSNRDRSPSRSRSPPRNRRPVLVVKKRSRDDSHAADDPNGDRSRRDRDGDDDDDDRERDRRVDYSTTGNKRRDIRSMVVTVRPKNGAGGDRHSRSDQQERPYQRQRPFPPHQQRARQPGRGPRSDAEQSPRQQS